MAGFGLVQGLDLMFEDELASGRLIELLPTYSAPGPPVQAVALPERARTPNVRAILGFLRETLGNPRRPTAPVDGLALAQPLE